MKGSIGSSILVCAWIAFGMVLAVAPVSPYAATLATEVIILALWSVSYNLVYGYMGEISFGHAAFFGLGAFGVPLLAREIDLSFGLSIAGGVAVACLFAMLASIFIRRTRGVYYAVLTFVLAEVVYVIAIKWTSFTGGDNGLPVSRPAALGSPVRYSLFAFVIVTFALAALYRIINSPAGRVVQAIHQNERRARQVGYNTTTYRALIFVLSGTFSGLAGALLRAIPAVCFSRSPVLDFLRSGHHNDDHWRFRRILWSGAGCGAVRYFARFHFQLVGKQCGHRRRGVVQAWRALAAIHGNGILFHHRLRAGRTGRYLCATEAPHGSL